MKVEQKEIKTNKMAGRLSLRQALNDAATYITLFVIDTAMLPAAMF